MRLLAGLLAASAAAVFVGDTVAPTAARAQAATLTYAFPGRTAIAPLRACASSFERTHPSITVRLEPAPEGVAYSRWLHEQLAGSQPPDAFAVPAEEFPALLGDSALEPLEGLISKQRLAAGGYWRGLQRLWTGFDGRQYALPTTVETAALAVHRKLVRGVVPWSRLTGARWGSSLRSWGRFEETLWRLTIDVRGRRGPDPGFPDDFGKRRIRTYALALGTRWADGFDSWLGGLGAAGRVVDRNPWPSRFRYSQTALPEFLRLWRREVTHRYMPPLSDPPSSAVSEFATRRTVMAVVSSADAVTVAAGSRDAAFLPVPRGDDGRRRTPMRAAFADAVSARSPQRLEAAHLVSLLGSKRCATALAATPRGLPAVRAAAGAWIQATGRAAGTDVAAFVPRDGGSIALGLVVRERATLDTAAAAAFGAILRGRDATRQLAELDATLNANR